MARGHCREMTIFRWFQERSANSDQRTSVSNKSRIFSLPPSPKHQLFVRVSGLCEAKFSALLCSSLFIYFSTFPSSVVFVFVAPQGKLSRLCACHFFFLFEKRTIYTATYGVVYIPVPSCLRSVSCWFSSFVGRALPVVRFISSWLSLRATGKVARVCSLQRLFVVNPAMGSGKEEDEGPGREGKEKLFIAWVPTETKVPGKKYHRSGNTIR